MLEESFQIFPRKSKVFKHVNFAQPQTSSHRAPTFCLTFDFVPNPQLAATPYLCMDEHRQVRWPLNSMVLPLFQPTMGHCREWPFPLLTSGLMTHTSGFPVRHPSARRVTNAGWNYGNRTAVFIRNSTLRCTCRPPVVCMILNYWERSASKNGW